MATNHIFREVFGWRGATALSWYAKTAKAVEYRVSLSSISAAENILTRDDRAQNGPGNFANGCKYKLYVICRQATVTTRATSSHHPTCPPIRLIFSNVPPLSYCQSLTLLARFNLPIFSCCNDQDRGHMDIGDGTGARGPAMEEIPKESQE
jgi:hypothetical protein